MADLDYYMSIIEGNFNDEKDRCECGSLLLSRDIIVSGNEIEIKICSNEECATRKQEK